MSTGRQPRFSPGSTVDGRYRIRRLMGRWQVGTAYAATPLRGTESVTLLVMDVRPAAVPQYLRWVRIEADQQRVVPAGLLTPTDGGHLSGDTVYMVLGGLRGVPLATRIRQDGSLDEVVAIRFFEALARMLGRAHAEGVCLGSVRPTNVFLDGDPEAPAPVVFDPGFARGLSRLLDYAPREAERFVAPDRHPEMPSAADDIFSLGALLYFALTARKPPPVDREGRRVVTPPSWKRHDSTLCSYIDPVVLKAMAPQARDRHDLCEELADELAALDEVFRLSPDARAVLGLQGVPAGAERRRHTHPHYLHDLLGLPEDRDDDIAPSGEIEIADPDEP
ncbi:MAG: hypothetical protein KC620_17910 [Myxococcales bacterium]|nr:hypothetical protein [Myxococcales bacterium]